MAATDPLAPGPSLVDRLLGFVGLSRVVTAGPGEMATPVLPAVLTDVTLAQVREFLREHDRGQFLQSALLAEQLLREPHVYGALTQRLEALLGLPHAFEPAAETSVAKQQAADFEARWPVIAPRPAQRECLNSGVMLGYAVGQLVWQWHDDAGELIPRLLPWPSALVEHREFEQRWYAHTTTGPVPITPGDGQWVLYTPRAVNRPYLWGAIRCVAEWYLREANAGGAASRHAEVHGVPVWLASLPASARETKDARAFLGSIRNMGRNAVVPLPQGDGPSTSYGLKLEAAGLDAHKIFEFLMRVGGGKIRLAILGQDLTSQNNQVGTNASSETGRSVTQDITRADAESWGECCRAQIAVPWARYRARPDLAPKVILDAEPAEDVGKAANALKVAGEAAKAWQDAGWDVDLKAHAKRFNVPGKIAPEPEPPPPPANLPPGTDPANPPPVPPAAPPGKKAAAPAPDPLAPLLAGQTYVDDVTDRARRQAVAALDPITAVVFQALEAAAKADDPYGELRRLLLGAFPQMDEHPLRQLVQGAVLLGEAAGTWSARREVA